MNKLLWAALISGFVVVIGIFGYNKLMAKASESEILVERDDVEALNVNIDFSLGDLLITGGSPEWVSGEVDYNHKKLEPKVKYKQRRGVGFVDIKQGKRTIFGIKERNLKNNWDLQLTNDIPIDLDVEMGVSSSKLELEGIQLSSLSIDSGVGESIIDLSGDWSNSFKADLDLGVGDVTLILPKETGAKLKDSKGIGSLDAKGFISQGDQVYVNEAYADADVIIDIQIDIGVGQVTVELAD